MKNLNDVIKIFPINTYFIYRSKYGDTSAIVYNVIENGNTYYIESIAKNNKYHINKYNIFDCFPDIKRNMKMQRKKKILNIKFFC